MANDILNNLFPPVINTYYYPISLIGRPRLTNEERNRRELEKQSKQKGKVGRPKIYICIFIFYFVIFIIFDNCLFFYFTIIQNFVV